MDCAPRAPRFSGPTRPPAPVVRQHPIAPPVTSAAATPPGAKLGGMPTISGGGAAPGATAARAATAKPGADLFGDLDSAGSESEDIEVAAARAVPIAPGSTGYDDKPTGQRNENSVLFSLDSLKAGFIGGAPAAAERSKPSAPKPGAPRPTQPSNPDDPFGMGASAGLAGMGAGGNPLFSLNANQ